MTQDIEERAQNTQAPGGSRSEGSSRRRLSGHLISVVLAALIPAGLLTSACSSGRPADHSQQVRTDGNFDDWRDSRPLIEDPRDAEDDSAVDLGAVHVQDDPDFLYFALDLGRPVNAQSMKGTLEILLDADGRTTTGATVDGLAGVDLALVLSRRDSPRPLGYGAGNGIRPVWTTGPSQEIRHADDSRLLTAPTHSANRIEVRIRRGRIFQDVPPLAVDQAVNLKVTFRDEGGLRDDTPKASHRLQRALRKAPPRATAADPPPPPKGTFRVLQWNVAADFMRRNPQAFRRIFQALSPDVVLLDEVLRDSTAAELLALLPEGRWNIVEAVGGGRQKTIVASTFPLRPEPLLQPLMYPEGRLKELADQVERDGIAPKDAIFGAVEVEGRAGIATVGAWVQVGGRSLLLTPLDLQSGGYHGSWEDRLRILQAAVLQERLSQVLEAAPDASGLIVAGDLNLVGSPTPLDVLRRSWPLSASGLEAAPAERLGDASQVTWRSLTPGPFTPGRLDFILYSASGLHLEQSFVFDSEAVVPERLRDLGLEAEDSRKASRHLPTIADFRWTSKAAAGRRPTRPVRPVE